MSPKITIELTPEQLEKIKASGILEEKKGWFVPSENDHYFYLAGTGIGDTTNSNINIDSAVFSRQQVFRTREEAEAADRLRIAITAVKKYCAENMPFEPDWGNTRQEKWLVTLNRKTNIFYESVGYSSQLPLVIPYMGSHIDVKRLIDDMKPELEIIFGITK